jgi:hypothetical protein
MKEVRGKTKNCLSISYIEKKNIVGGNKNIFIIAKEKKIEKLK